MIPDNNMVMNLICAEIVRQPKIFHLTVFSFCEPWWSVFVTVQFSVVSLTTIPVQ